MKKLTILAVSLAAMIILTACPHKPDDKPQPEPLQLSDVVGRYEGSLTVDAEKVGNPAVETYKYQVYAEIEEKAIGGIDPSRSFSCEWRAFSDVQGATSIYGRRSGEFTGDTMVFMNTQRIAYKVNTSWGIVGVADRHGEYFDFISVEVPVTMATDGRNLTLTYADTVRGFVDVDDESCTIILRHTLRASRVH
ncbi:MAG: hypothetical protein K2F84_05710 [Bacteroidales bacterium]|nr:hypothetical protein [Bacteroidales bacterium]